MALIFAMVNSTNPSAHTHLRRLVWKDFYHLPHSKLPCNTSTLVITRISIGLLWRTWMTSLTRNQWRNEEECCSFMEDNAPFSPSILYTGPPPSPPQPWPPDASLPTITDLSPRIILSASKLFFVAHNIGNGNASIHKWCLVHVTFQDSISFYPAALQDGRFMVKFMSCTLMMYNAMPQNNGFGCSILITPRSHLALLMPISSHHLIHPRPNLCATI